MSVTYTDPDGSTVKLITQVMKEHHAPLAENKVKLHIQFATPNDENTPAIKVLGRETFGRIKFTTEEDRAGGAPDVRMLLDSVKWKAASTDEQTAWVDQLLQSFEVRMTADATPEVIYDAAERPKLKRRKPDLYLCGFSDIAKRHGVNSPEHATVKVLRDRFNQLHLFDGSEPSAFEKKAKGNGKQDRPTMQMAQ